MSQRTTRLRGPLAALLIALGVGAVLLVGEVACFSPVSYTHLDVYKRQTPAPPTGPPSARR